MRRPVGYALDPNGVHIPIFDYEEWARTFVTVDRVVQQDDVNGYYVSTVFLGLDHNFFGVGDPILYETMVQTPTGAWTAQHRYCTKVEALAGHKRAMAVLTQDRARLEEMTGEVVKAALVSIENGDEI